MTQRQQCPRASRWRELVHHASSFAQRSQLAVSLVSASTAVLLTTESKQPELISTLCLLLGCVKSLLTLIEMCLTHMKSYAKCLSAVLTPTDSSTETSVYNGDGCSCCGLWRKSSDVFVAALKSSLALVELLSGKSLASATYIRQLASWCTRKLCNLRCIYPPGFRHKSFNGPWI